MRYCYAACTTRGSVRKQNQDNFFLNGRTMALEQGELTLSGASEQDAALFSVCDGMGGERSGEVAASLAVEELKKYPADSFALTWKECIQSANKAICKQSRKQGGRMGCTFTALSFQGRNALAVNVGDSRIYHLRGNTIRQISKDHTEFQSMVDAKIFKKEDFPNTMTHNHLTQHLGIEEWEMELEPHVERVSPVQAGDRFLLCSDGLYGVVADMEILCILNEANSLEEACRELVDAALEQGSRDNVTALAVQVLEASAPVSAPERQAPASAGQRPSAPEAVQQTKTAAPKVMQQTKNVAAQKKNGPLLLLVGALLVAALAGTAYYWWQNPTVSNVVSLTAEDAKEKLSAAGFRTKTTETYSADQEKGVVLGQSAQAGARLPRGSTITLEISKGGEPVELPGVVGQTEDEAVAALEKLGVSAQIVREYSDTVAEGCVISQFPEESTRTLPGASVTLTVSQGKEPVKLPDVVGLPEEAARTRLEELGLQVQIRKTKNGKGKTGTVLTQNPVGGQEVPEGETVVLEVRERKKKKKKKQMRQAEQSVQTEQSEKSEKNEQAELVAVPELVGLSNDDAWQLLKQVGLDPVWDWDTSGTTSVEPGYVTAQTQKAGTELPHGSKVHYLVRPNKGEENS